MNLKKIKNIPGKNALTSNTFVCPYCHAVSQFECKRLAKLLPIANVSAVLISAQCVACDEFSIFLISNNEELQLFPYSLTDIPQPNEDMPEDIKKIYLEAATVLKDSPRASAALSRLAIDHLTLKFSDKNNLNSRIADMVSKGLSPMVQQALDTVRVIGNNAVHPGTINLGDNTKLALSLLELVNLIVDKQISEPKKIQEVYDRLPKSSLEAIKKRDSK